MLAHDLLIVLIKILTQVELLSLDLLLIGVSNKALSIIIDERSPPPLRSFDGLPECHIAFLHA